jgi:hypothetical protein
VNQNRVRSSPLQEIIDACYEEALERRVTHI